MSKEWLYQESLSVRDNTDIQFATDRPETLIQIQGKYRYTDTWKVLIHGYKESTDTDKKENPDTQIQGKCRYTYEMVNSPEWSGFCFSFFFKVN